MSEARAKLTQAILAVRNNAGMITPQFRDDMRKAKIAAREVVECDLAALAGQIEMAGDQAPMDLRIQLFAGASLHVDCGDGMKPIRLTDQIRRALAMEQKDSPLFNAASLENQAANQSRIQWADYFMRLTRDAKAQPRFSL